VLDKRQLAYKVTANSLYGQCGAKTSTFYEVDVAASTTATGRKLLTYAKRMVEEVYGDAVVTTKAHGTVLTRAEYVYGDSVAAHTPVYVRLGGVIDVCPIEALAEKYGASPNANTNTWTQCKEEGKQTKEVCEMICGVETWTEKGWTRLHRVIRHALAPHKKMMRIVTHTGIVDVTDDHSLILANGEEISPKNVEIGTKLLHSALPLPSVVTIPTVTVEQARVMGASFAADNYEKKIIPTSILNGTREVRESFWNGMLSEYKIPPIEDKEEEEGVRGTIGSPVLTKKIKSVLLAYVCWLKVLDGKHR